MAKKTYDEDDLKRIAELITEDIGTRIDALEENMGAIIERKVRPIVQEELVEAREDIKLIKAAVTDTNKDLHKLERRVARLEATRGIPG